MTLLVYLPLLLYFVGLFIVILMLSKPGPTLSSAIMADPDPASVTTEESSAPATTVKPKEIALFAVALTVAVMLISFVTTHQHHATPGIPRSS